MTMIHHATGQQFRFPGPARKPGEPLTSWRARRQIIRRQADMDAHLDEAACAAADVIALTSLVPEQFRDDHDQETQ